MAIISVIGMVMQIMREYMYGNKEQQEYIEFMAKLSNKSKEVREDFDKLSPGNQIRVKQFAEKLLMAGGLASLWDGLSR